jgi:hypothetical protein
MSTIDTITITATISILTCAMLADDSLHVFLHKLQPIQAPQKLPKSSHLHQIHKEISQLLRESARLLLSRSSKGGQAACEAPVVRENHEGRQMMMMDGPRF